MTPLDRLQSATRSPHLPLALLLLALSTVFLFGGDRGSFYRPHRHSWTSAQHLTIAVNISPEHGFQRFVRRIMDEDGAVRYAPYNRFPIGGYLSMKLATLPASGDLSAQILFARILMLLFFTAAAVLAYLSLCRLVSNRWIALTATLLSFSSFYLLYYNDMTANEGMPDLFGVMLVFHGMVVFVQEGRFRQLLVKTCIALLLGWHVFALLLPFVILGLASDLLRARSAAASLQPSTVFHRGKRMAIALLRSRYLLLGIVALGFGLAILTFNFAMEYIALDGQTPLTELPSFQSMLKRTSTGLDAGVVQASWPRKSAPIPFYPVNAGVLYATWPWGAFFEVQFLRIFLMFVPYGLIGGGGILESPPWQTQFQGVVIPAANINAITVIEWLSKFQGVVLGVGLSGACLIGLMFTRQRMLFATLASFGFFWALPMRQTTVLHGFESMYYVGLPMVFFSLVLLRLRGLARGRLIPYLAAGSALLFAVSSFQMSRVAHGAESARFAQEAEQDMIVIRELTEETGVVTVLPLDGLSPTESGFGWESYKMVYYLNRSFLRFEDRSEQGFSLMRERIDTDALLTPQNRQFFLYDSAGLMTAYRSMYRSISSGKPLERSNFDVYLEENRLYYLKEPCPPIDTRVSFFLHVVPIDLYDLPDDRRGHGFDNLDFRFAQRGVMFDGKCLAMVRLPHYDAASVRTGQFDDVVGEVWSVEYVNEDASLMAEYSSIVSGELAASAEFDLYIDGRALYYVKEPCGVEDTQPHFFLHVVPADLGDLRDDRRGHGFDNLDFGFDVRGVMSDGRCIARVFLPKHDVARITTGQYDGAERIWEVNLAPDALE